MTLPGVAAFTDTYLPTVNGVTYTVKTWRECWEARGGRMDVVYPDGDHEPDSGEYPVRSLPFPFYEGYRVGLPHTPDSLPTPDIVHAHSAFALGLAALRAAGSFETPLVASYHTPTAEYANYVSVNGTLERRIRAVATAYERWYLDRADVVVVPSEVTGRSVRDEVGVSTPVEVVPNGVDTETFAPVDTDFRERYHLPDGPLIGYTGRHGFEKNLDLLIDAVAGLGTDATLVFGGDGPARDSLESRAAEAGVDARFLGFLDRDELPEFYAAIDVFGFPSPVETQGLVALEANACGTPVAGVEAGALGSTIEDGENGYAADSVDVETFRETIERTFADVERLRERCLARREEISVETAIDRLEAVYDSVR
jgi:glycosyltransferase involved in cell wall biosynthesis